MQKRFFITPIAGKGELPTGLSCFPAGWCLPAACFRQVLVRRAVLLLFFLCMFPAVFAQSPVKTYFQRHGMEIIAGLAHPFNTYKDGEVMLIKDVVYVNVKYTNGAYTKMKLYRKGVIIHHIEIVSDTDSAAPFWASTFMKDLLYEVVRESSPEEIAQVEQVIGDSLQQMSSIDLCCAILSLGILNL